MKTNRFILALPIVVLLLAALIAVFYPRPPIQNSQDSGLIYAHEINTVASAENTLYYNCRETPQPTLKNVLTFGDDQNENGALFITETQTSFRLCVSGNKIYVADLVVFSRRNLRTGGGKPTHVQIDFLTPEEFPQDRKVIGQNAFPLGGGGKFEFVIRNQFGQTWLISGEMTEYDDSHPEQGFATIRLRFSANLQVQMVN